MSEAKKRCLAAGMAFIFAFARVEPVILAADAPAAADQQPGKAAAQPQLSSGEWPRTLEKGGVTFNVYQPQPLSWDGYRLQASAAVKASEGGQQDHEIFGAIQIEAATLVNKEARTVTLDQLKITEAKFPALADQGAHYRDLLNQIVGDRSSSVRKLALDRLEATLNVAGAKTKAAQGVKNEAPEIVFASVPTVLVYIDGAPVYRVLEKTELERVINTRIMLVKDASGAVFLRIFDGWMQAPSLQGPWSVTPQPSQKLDEAFQAALEARAIDPLTGTDPNDKNAKPPSLKTDVPGIVVATQPTELIVTNGAPQYLPIAGTDLLYVENTTGNIFKDTADQQLYLLLTGRWFKAAAEAGPFAFVSSEKLPKDFRNIPDDSPKENVKASVAGTQQAQEAVIASSVPQTAKVDRKKAKFTPKFDGGPRFEPIEGTTIARVVNSATPILRVDAKHYYAVENGVWFQAPDMKGPWLVADRVPPVIYTIPPSSPVYNVTYVYVYDATPTTVVVGYTPGYYGSYVVGGTVVYGTGYHYTPWVGSIWYGPPVTYGFAANPAYTPWTGWAFAFGLGWAWGRAMSYGAWGWGPHPWWGPAGVGFYSRSYYPYAYRAGAAVYGPHAGSHAAWGPGGWSASSGNVYHRWGGATAVTRSSGGYNAYTGDRWGAQAGRSYNSRTGTLSAGQRSAVGNVYSGNYRASSSGAAVNERTGSAVAGRKATAGNVHTGEEVTAARGAVRNPSTGRTTAVAGVRGEQGGAARVGDDLYVSRDGNVARKDAEGWQQQGADGRWNRNGLDVERSSELDRASRQRAEGERRQQTFEADRSSRGQGQGTRERGTQRRSGGGGRGRR